MNGAKELAKTLTPSQAALLHLLKNERDVPIQRLYEMLHTERRPRRRQQQIVGSVISRLNQRLAALGYVVKPGEKRRTYRLRLIDAQG